MPLRRCDTLDMHARRGICIGTTIRVRLSALAAHGPGAVFPFVRVACRCGLLSGVTGDGPSRSVVHNDHLCKCMFRVIAECCEPRNGPDETWLCMRGAIESLMLDLTFAQVR